MTGGWLGWLGYDLAWEIEQLPQLKPDPLPFPVAFWIEELEPVRRSLFYGYCGYIDQHGTLGLTILICTLLATTQNPGVKGQKQPLSLREFSHSNILRIVSGQVGAGIVADSDPEKEWYESLHKAQAQLRALKALSL